MESLPGLPDVSDDDDGEHDDDDISDGAENCNEAGAADEETAERRRRPWRERRMKSLLNSIKNRISGDRVDTNLPARDPVSLVAGNVTLDVLQHLLPNLNTRPCSTVDPTQAPKLSRTLQRQMCLRKQKADCGLNKDRAKTAPCGLEGSLSFPFDEDYPSGGVKSASSTPDLMYPADVNVVPSFFRSRSHNLTQKNFRRANSAQ